MAPSAGPGRGARAASAAAATAASPGLRPLPGRAVRAPAPAQRPPRGTPGDAVCLPSASRSPPSTRTARREMESAELQGPQNEPKPISDCGKEEPPPTHFKFGEVKNAPSPPP
ncbi:atherin-like [Nannospalax galili]|uniref:atherin-like n=1 Tax=Nannospalax galili TaxID=1026970 RepID=UPI00111C79D7|nr:atherin-like [Nannospalax galili]